MPHLAQQRLDVGIGPRESELAAWWQEIIVIPQFPGVMGLADRPAGYVVG